MNFKKLIPTILAAGLGIAGLILIIKIIGGAFSMLGRFVNMILGLAVIAALIAIVIWMFSYAKKNSSR